MAQESLRSRLSYEPRELQFGTSGRRGEVVHLTQLEIYINALAELRYLQSLPPDKGGIASGEDFYFAHDLRPSSTSYVAVHGGRGEIAQAIEQAIRDAGMQPVNLGYLPTPALTYYALLNGKGSMMITGSHIPFDRNGYKTNTSAGELLKEDEQPIAQLVAEVRQIVYDKPYADSSFSSDGSFKTQHRQLPLPIESGRSAYIERYTQFFGDLNLHGWRVLVYEHSAVGRDLLAGILAQFDAGAIRTGRSETFVPIDTENIDAQQLATIQALADDAIAQHGSIDAVVSTDGDSDRPLVLAVEPRSNKLRFISGDLLGMLTAEYLGADAVVVPISCNDAIDRGRLAHLLEPKTRIGSPYVVAGMQQAIARGKKVVCGWEANGGFLLGSDLKRNGRTLRKLPTRDAVLPILSVLFSAKEKGTSLLDLLESLPKRFGRSGLLKQFPRSISLKIIARLSPSDPAVRDIRFEADSVTLLNSEHSPIAGRDSLVRQAKDIRDVLERFFNTQLGFEPIAQLNFTDGVRIRFGNGDIAHLRPSGNADELRIYALSDSPARAEAISSAALSEPDGILRRLERFVTEES